jgi:hypothetical protein
MARTMSYMQVCDVCASYIMCTTMNTIMSASCGRLWPAQRNVLSCCPSEQCSYPEVVSAADWQLLPSDWCDRLFLHSTAEGMLSRNTAHIVAFLLQWRWRQSRHLCGKWHGQPLAAVNASHTVTACSRDLS